MSVYRCNKTDRAMRDIKVNTVGITSHMRTGTPSRSAPLSTTPTSLTIEQLAPNTALLIDRYEPMIDGDFITFYNAAFIDQQDQKQLIHAAIGPSGPPQSSSQWWRSRARFPQPTKRMPIVRPATEIGSY